MPDLKISLRAARINAELKQREVADILNVEKSTVSSWERGLSQPKIEQAQLLSQIYKIPLDNLIFLPKKLA